MGSSWYKHQRTRLGAPIYAYAAPAHPLRQVIAPVNPKRLCPCPLSFRRHAAIESSNSWCFADGEPSATQETAMKRFIPLSASLWVGLTAPALALEKATLRLNWLLYGFHAPFYLGEERGYYRAEGIDLEIEEGQGSQRAVQIIATKGDTFGLSDGLSIINGITSGAPIKAVMGVMNTTPSAIIARDDAGINSLADLEGKTIAATEGEAALGLMLALLKANKLDAAKVHFLHVEGPDRGPVKMAAVVEKRAAAFLGGSDHQSLLLEQKGVKPKVFHYADFGINMIGLAIHTHADTLEHDPKLVTGFIKATQKAFADAETEPKAAIAAAMKVNPDLNETLALRQLQAGLRLVRSKAAADAPIGFMAQSDWRMTLDLMKEYQELKTDMPASAFFTNELVPQ
jgi:NitT/TauT family transport system substrate-binding protein